jgi:hypothetical protein
MPGKDKIKKTTGASAAVLSLKAKNIEIITGKKLSLKEKLEFAIFKYAVRKKIISPGVHKEDNKGQTALVLAIIGLITVFIPYAVILALPCAIAALIIGYSARRRDPDNKKARTAIVLGWLTIGLIVVALFIALVILTAFVLY